MQWFNTDYYKFWIVHYLLVHRCIIFPKFVCITHFRKLLLLFDPFVNWHKGRKAMQRNDKYGFSYMYFTPRTMRVYLPGKCSKTTIPADARPKNSLLWTHNKRFMEPLFGVNRWWYGEAVANKKGAAFGARTKINAKDKNVIDKSKTNAVRYTRPNSYYKLYDIICRETRNDKFIKTLKLFMWKWWFYLIEHIDYT